MQPSGTAVGLRVGNVGTDIAVDGTAADASAESGPAFADGSHRSGGCAEESLVDMHWTVVRRLDMTGQASY